VAFALSSDALGRRRQPLGPPPVLTAPYSCLPPIPTSCTGPARSWEQPPFRADQSKDGMLYGRGRRRYERQPGAMVVRSRFFVAAFPDHKGSIAFLITSDEEGPATLRANDQGCRNPGKRAEERSTGALSARPSSTEKGRRMWQKRRQRLTESRRPSRPSRARGLSAPGQQPIHLRSAGAGRR